MLGKKPSSAAIATAPAKDGMVAISSVAVKATGRAAVETVALAGYSCSKMRERLSTVLILWVVVFCPAVCTGGFSFHDDDQAPSKDCEHQDSCLDHSCLCSGKVLPVPMPLSMPSVDAAPGFKTFAGPNDLSQAIVPIKRDGFLSVAPPLSQILLPLVI